MEIWLADLTYDQQSLASDVVPAAIGGLAELIELTYGFNTKLFKQPQILLDTIKENQPDLIGFSNYVWNANLALKLSELIKKTYPNITIVFGGPNISTDNDELHSYLLGYPFIDYIVLKEGESGIINLVKSLVNSKKGALIKDGEIVNGVAYLDSKKSLVKGELERFLNLEALPSPYLSGRLDEWLDGKWLPVIQTNRGCPFTCTFCTEGQTYWSKVRKKPIKLLEDELQYIAKKITENKIHRNDLLIADSNFGMYDQDLEIAKSIAKVQDSFNFPTYINVATGKNKKEKVLEVASIVKGAMKLAGSVQSLDAKVLINIKRDNIQPESLMDMALEASKIGTNTYSEVILGLPGDTTQAHLSTLQKLIDAGFTTIAMYQMMLLPGTEMDKKETREKYGFVSRYRILPRCFGTYTFLDSEINVAEIEEIVIAHKSLSIDDYLYCRRFNLITTIFYNDGIFLEFHKLLSRFGISSFEWLRKIFTNSQNGAIDTFFKNFEKDTIEELWLSKSELKELTNTKQYIDLALDGEVGNNILFMYKALSLTNNIEIIFDKAYKSYIDILKSNSVLDNPVNSISEELIEDLFNYRKAQIKDSLLAVKSSVVTLNYFDTPDDLENVFKSLEIGEKIDFQKYTVGQKISKNWELIMTRNQLNEISAFIELFGIDKIGLSRTLSRIFLRNYFKNYGGKTELEAKSLAIPSSQFGLREI
jgi:radical SAM superfamily enzyme YgiQ (UPF0313 family)